eukprot:20291-Eustigmatos_ZCMA.PRE.1
MVAFGWALQTGAWKVRHRTVNSLLGAPTHIIHLIAMATWDSRWSNMLFLRQLKRSRHAWHQCACAATPIRTPPW